MTSMYHYAQPAATHQFSDNTKRHATMAGVMSPSYRCAKCNEHKQIAKGRKKCIGGWACPDCQSRKPAIFTAMLTGSLAIPEVPKKHVRKVTFDEARQANPNAAVEISLDKVRLAMKDGLLTLDEIAAHSGLCRATAIRRLNDLVDKEEAVKTRHGARRVEWRLK